MPSAGLLALSFKLGQTLLVEGVEEGNDKRCF